MDVSTLNEKLLFCTAYLECDKPKGRETATGIIYAVSVKMPNGQEGSIHLLVTNKHVLADATKVSVQMVGGGEPPGKPNLGNAWVATISDFSAATWTGHPNPDVDIAVIPLSFVLNQMMEATGTSPFFKALTPSIAMTESSSQELDAIEEIVFIGYPRGIYDSVNFLPVTRRGTTATHPAVDYEGLPAFLIDASVFPGSSGSPVLIAQTGSYNDRSGALVIGNRVMFLGILVAVHLSPVIGKIETSPVSDQVSVTDIPMNLGIVYKAQAVEATIDTWLAVHDFERVARPPGETGQESAVDQAAAAQTQEKVDEAKMDGNASS